MSRINWLEWRMGGIGGSDAPIVMETSPFGTPDKLWGIKTRRRLPDPQNYQMRRGLKLEPVARELYEKQTGILMPKKELEHPKISFARASLDGLNLKAGKALEIKCPGRKDHATAAAGKVPDKYLYQLVHNCMVAEIDEIDYFSYYDYGGVEDTRLITFKRDRKLEEKLLSQENWFWECVQQDVSPSERKSKMSTKVSKSSFTAREVCEILEFAKKMGVATMKLDGFEAAFEVARPGELQEAQVEDTEETTPDESSCPHCGSEFVVGNYGLYCKPCYMARLDENRKGRAPRKPTSVLAPNNVFRVRKNWEDK